jgi:medium-chain acyl-[acyl-carrier-protein] hydrolase
MNTSFLKKAVTSSWVTCPQPNPQAKMRLFCFPYAGGSAQLYHKWSAKLPASVEVCPIQLPGRGNRMREPAFEQLMPLVKAISKALLPYLNKPFSFFGYSMGAMISFELTRLLQAEYALKPAHFFVAGRTAPQIENTEPHTYHLPETEFLQSLKDLNGTPKALLANAELMQLMTPLLRADFEVCQTYAYVPGPRLDCPMSVYGGTQDDHVSLEAYEAWKEQTSGPFKLTMYEGDHFFIHSHQQELLQALGKELDQTVSHSLYSPASLATAW